MKVLKLIFNSWLDYREHTVCPDCGWSMPLQIGKVAKLNPDTNKEYTAQVFWYVCQTDNCPRKGVRVPPTLVDA